VNLTAAFLPLWRLTAFGFGWLGPSVSYWQPDSQREEPTAVSAIHAVVERIIGVESDGDLGGPQNAHSWFIVASHARRPTESLPVILTAVNHAVEILCNKISLA
jgi:hypothetical protein